MDRLRRALTLAVVAALMLAPAVAAACPACAGQQRDTTLLKVLGILILFPFVVFGVVLRAIRNADRDGKRPIE
jgi:hypothetical protein